MRRSLAFQLFLAVLAVSLATVSAVALIARRVFAQAFTAYLGLPHRPMMALPPRPGREALTGATELAFSAAVDQGIVLGALAAVVLAIVAALLIARWLGTPLGRLTGAARALASGDLDHRVSPAGPAEVAELGAAFNEMADSLEEAEALRRRLVADVAHELRDPVAALRAQAEGMAEGVLEPDGQRLWSIVDDLGHLSSLVDDLQELSVAEAGKLPYEMLEIDLGELLRREVERAQPLVGAGVVMTAQCEGGLHTVIGDDRRLAQVLRNLLSNAARHTQAGRIVARCAAGRDGVTVEVSDTGEGIPLDDLPYIFERFYRADAARTRWTGGVGIGLAIARRIVEDHGGRVYASSEPGEGATVGFALPAKG